MIETIYVDMDGVLVDMERYFLENCGGDSFYIKDKLGVPELIKLFHQHIKNEDMFSNLHPMDDHELAKHTMASLISGGYKVCILSCTSQTFLGNEIGDMMQAQKMRWLHHNKFFRMDIEAKFVDSHAEKAKYANSTTLLIDDSLACIEPFRAKGGHVIQHESFNKTNEELSKILLTHT
jgi:hypothetical protein